MVARAADGSLHVIDGQHTAISAASHPRVDRIPVMVVEAEDDLTRAVERQLERGPELRAKANASLVSADRALSELLKS